MSNDDNETPFCGICGDLIGMHNNAALVFRGQFFMNKQDGYAMFVLDPDTKFVSIELENALGPGQHQQAFVIEPAHAHPIVPVHEECLSEQALLDDEDDEVDDDDLDAGFHSAMSRDFDPLWDDNDMLRGSER